MFSADSRAALSQTWIWPKTSERVAARPALTSPKRAAVIRVARKGPPRMFRVSSPRRIGARSVIPDSALEISLHLSPF